MNFTSSEKVDMLEVYFRVEKNATMAVNTYREKYPDRQVPNRKVFTKLVLNLRTNGSFKVKKERKNTVITDENEADILAFFEANPQASIREVMQNFPISFGSISKILKKNGYHPFKPSILHNLMPGDEDRRVEFCAWYTEQAVNDENFVRNIIWTDETNFSNRGMYNRRNHHYWSNENPLQVHEGHDQVRFSLNCWCLMMGNRILRVHFYEGNLNGNRYRQFLEDVLFQALEEIPLNVRMNLFFSKTGPPSQQQRFQVPVDGFQLMDPRSPDLTPLDFYLWGYLKNKLYVNRYASVNEMRVKIMDLLQNIHHAQLTAATNDVMRRAHACLFLNGGHFEHLL